MDLLAIWMLCGIASSTAFVFSERRLIRDSANSFDDLMFVGIVLAIIAIGGPIALAGFCVGSAAKALARLIP